MRSINYKNENFEFKEPFDGLFTQGMVCHETYKDENDNWLSPDEVELINKEYFKKGDTRQSYRIIRINVKIEKECNRSENIISNYGADAVRLFILSDSPPQKDVQWSDQGMLSSYKFVQKLWALHQKLQSN